MQMAYDYPSETSEHVSILSRPIAFDIERMTLRNAFNEERKLSNRMEQITYNESFNVSTWSNKTKKRQLLMGGEGIGE